MSDAAIIAIITGVVTIATMLFSHLKASMERAEAREAAAKAAEAAAKAAEQIHILVNKGRSDMLDKIADLERRLDAPPSESEKSAAERAARDLVDKAAIERMNHPVAVAVAMPVKDLPEPPK